MARTPMTQEQKDTANAKRRATIAAKALPPAEEHTQDLEVGRAPSTGAAAGDTQTADGYDADGIRTKSAAEISSYEQAIESLRSFDRALGGVPRRQQDPELVAILAHWRESESGVMERFSRVKKRGA